MILMFLLSLLLTLVSAWSVGTFNRLNRVVGIYSNSELEAACQVSKIYVRVGLITGVIVTLLSLCVLALASWNLYKHFFTK